MAFTLREKWLIADSFLIAVVIIIHKLGIIHAWVSGFAIGAVACSWYYIFSKKVFFKNE